MSTLPRLELSDARSPFDEAVIIIDGDELNTITIEINGGEANPLDLADLIIRLVNAQREAAAPAECHAAPGAVQRSGDLA